MRFIELLCVFLLTSTLQAQSLKLIATLPTQGEANIQFTSLSKDITIVHGQKHAWMCRNNGQLITDTVYQAIDGRISFGRIKAQKSRGKTGISGFLNKRGEEVIPFEFDSAEPFEFGYAVVKKKDRHFLMDTLGNLTPIYRKYYAVTILKPGVLLAYQDVDHGYCGLIRYDGSVIAPFNYGQIYTTTVERLLIVIKGPFREPDAFFEKQFRSVIDTSGKIIIPMDYQDIRVYSNCIGVERYDTTGIRYFDLAGRPLSAAPPSLPGDDNLPPYLACKKFPNGSVCGLKDPLTGSLLTPVTFRNISKSKYGWFTFENMSYSGNMTCGYMTSKGELVLDRRYASNRPISQNDILFYSDMVRGPYRWYNGKGAEVFPSLIKKMELFFDDVISPEDTAGFEVLSVSLEGKKLGLYDRSGKMVVEEKFDSMVYLSKRSLWFKEGNQFGIINAKGEVTSTQTYPKIYRTGYFAPDGLPLLRSYINGASGIITETGKELLPCKYSSFCDLSFLGRKHLWCGNNKIVEVYEVLPEPKE